MKKIGMIDFYLDEYHALNYPKWIEERAGNEMRVEYAWAEIDKPSGMTNADFCRDKKITLLSSIDELLNKSDYIIVLSPDNPEKHIEYCEYALRSGKPTYVDKALAINRSEVLYMMELAKKSNTPFFSSSALRYAGEYASLPKEGIEFIDSRGPGEFENYAIHQLEPIIYLMGVGIEKIMFIGTDNTPSFYLRYADGRGVTISQLGWECDFNIAVKYADGHSYIANGDGDFYRNFIAAMVEFFKTRKPGVDINETLEIITILEYCKKAMANPCEWVSCL